MDKLMTYQDSGNDETDRSLRNHFYTIMDNSETETIAEFTVWYCESYESVVSRKRKSGEFIGIKTILQTESMWAYES